MFGIAKLFVLFTTLAVGATDDLESSYCSDTREPIPAGAEIVVTDTEILAIVGGNKTTYTCECTQGSGTCVPAVSPDYTSVECVGDPECQQCVRHASTSRGVAADIEVPVLEEELDFSTCLETTAEDDAAYEQRVKELDAELALAGFPGVSYDENDEALAPDGWLFLDEYVGGRTLLVPVVDDADVKAIAKPRAKCHCTTSGSCHWEGLKCVSNGYPKTCDSCGITLKGVKSDSAADPGNGNSGGNGPPETASPVEEQTR